MRCTYCEADVTEYPASGICPHCGGKLPPRPAHARCPGCGNFSSGNFCAVCGRSLNGTMPPPPVQSVHIPVQPVYIPVQQQVQFVPGINCCPKCRNVRIVHAKRGFRWGLGIFGFFLIPVFGLLLGFCGSGKPYLKCTACGHKWKR